MTFRDGFTRWRLLHGQAIGWEPNLDDGVRLANSDAQD